MIKELEEYSQSRTTMHPFPCPFKQPKKGEKRNDQALPVNPYYLDSHE